MKKNFWFLFRIRIQILTAETGPNEKKILDPSVSGPTTLFQVKSNWLTILLGKQTPNFFWDPGLQIHSILE
jgi:hypothetical protein